MFAILQQYQKKEVSDEVDFLYLVKHESLLQVDAMILIGMANIPRVPKLASLQCLYNVSEKKLEMKLIFCMDINIKVSVKLNSTLWASKFPTYRDIIIIDGDDQAFSKYSK